MGMDIKQGWNTWNVRSVLSHVHLPEAIAVSLGFKVYDQGTCLREALIGRRGDSDEKIVPGHHAYDGSYTSLELEWHKLKVRVETAVEDGEWCALVTPLNELVKTPALTIEAAVLWNRPGCALRDGETLVIKGGSKRVVVCASGTHREGEPVVEIATPYLMVALDGPVSVATDSAKLKEVPAIIERKKGEFLESRKGEGRQQEIYDAMQACLAWDTIYDPFKDRVISPVSRIWSCSAGGWTLFDWDTYFAAWMASVENKALAYANAVAITDEATEAGFIPNMAHPSGMKTRDRSQPPVGGITVQALCDMFDETVLAERLFEALLKWNRWWPDNRDCDGYLCWGSSPCEPVTGNQWETNGVNERFGGALESGLDNSPMYDDIPFDNEKHLLLLADVGLMSFYIADCRALADLAGRLGRADVVDELNERAERYAERLRSLWSEEVGLFLNKRLDTGELQHRLSPTHFYPLLAEVPTESQAKRMIDEHFFNEDEFWGEWILPAIARDDPNYGDQRYWRGRIWAPMNFLVYLGLRKYDLPKAREALVEKSEALLLKEWREKGHVHENYNADTGEGCDIESSDAFYHWGGLLGLISVMEHEQKS